MTGKYQQYTDIVVLWTNGNRLEQITTKEKNCNQGSILVNKGKLDKTRQDKTLFTLGPLLNGVGGIYTKYLCKTRDKMVEKHITKYLKIQINI